MERGWDHAREPPRLFQPRRKGGGGARRARALFARPRRPTKSHMRVGRREKKARPPLTKPAIPPHPIPSIFFFHSFFLSHPVRLTRFLCYLSFVATTAPLSPREFRVRWYGQM